MNLFETQLLKAVALKSGHRLRTNGHTFIVDTFLKTTILDMTSDGMVSEYVFNKIFTSILSARNDWTDVQNPGLITGDLVMYIPSWSWVLGMLLYCLTWHRYWFWPWDVLYSVEVNYRLVWKCFLFITQLGARTSRAMRRSNKRNNYHFVGPKPMCGVGHSAAANTVNQWANKEQDQK